MPGEHGQPLVRAVRLRRRDRVAGAAPAADDRLSGPERRRRAARDERTHRDEPRGASGGNASRHRGSPQMIRKRYFGSSSSSLARIEKFTFQKNFSVANDSVGPA